MLDNRLILFCFYLDKIEAKLKKFFDSQKEYICCKEGCSKCCENGVYPCTELEYQFLKLGFDHLDFETRNTVIENISKIKQTISENDGKISNYTCPFLINNRCSVYFFRPLICRVFGLPQYDDKGVIKVPFCVDDGLNYSKVYNKDDDTISVEKYEELGFKEEPLAFNLRLPFLIREVGEEGMGLDFGERKTIIEWF